MHQAGSSSIAAGLLHVHPSTFDHLRLVLDQGALVCASLFTLATVTDIVAIASSEVASPSHAVAFGLDETASLSSSLQLVKFDTAQQPEVFSSVFVLSTIMTLTQGSYVGCVGWQSFLSVWSILCS